MRIVPTLLNTIQRGEQFISRIVFPSRCLCCNRSHEKYLCPACLDHIPLKIHQQCPYCQKATTTYGQLCPNCYGKTALNAIFSATSFKEPLIKKLIHTFKYRFIESLAPELSNILIRSLKNSEIPLPDILMSVPLHARRYRMRGFNQSKLLAQYLSPQIAPGIRMPLSNSILKRTRYTLPQAHITDRKDRLRNLENAFKIIHTPPIQNKTIWLIDDVSTTGGTLFACAEVLKEAGAKEIYGIVIAS